MDTAIPQTPTIAPSVSPYTWMDADAANPDTTTPQSIDGGPQVSQPAAVEASAETPKAATIRRVATGVAGLGLVAAAVVATKMLRGANAAAGVNVIDYDE